MGELVDVSPDVWLHLNVPAKKAKRRRKAVPRGEFQELRLPAPFSLGSGLRAQDFSPPRPMSQSGGSRCLSGLGSQPCRGLMGPRYSCAQDDEHHLLRIGRFGDTMHNSIHPLWIPELGAYLCVGHQHIRNGYVHDSRDYHEKHCALLQERYGII